MKKYIDLLLLLNSKSSDYVLLQDYNRFVTNKQNIMVKTFLLILLIMLFLRKGIRIS